MKKVAEAQSGMHKVEYLRKSEDDDWMGPAPKYRPMDKPGDYHHRSVASHTRAGRTHQISVLTSIKEEKNHIAHVHDPKDHSKVIHVTEPHETPHAAAKAARRWLDKVD
jgi:hypothetical protein